MQSPATGESIGLLPQSGPSDVVYIPADAVYRPSDVVYRPTAAVYRPSDVV